MARKCLDCGKNEQSKIAKQKILQIIKDHGGLLEEDINPGGREIILNSGDRIQIFDYCLWCDLETIKKYFQDK